MAAALHSFLLHLLTSLVRGSPWGVLKSRAGPTSVPWSLIWARAWQGGVSELSGPVPLLPLGLEGCPRGGGRGVWGRLDDGRRWEGLEGRPPGLTHLPWSSAAASSLPTGLAGEPTSPGAAPMLTPGPGPVSWEEHRGPRGLRPGSSPPPLPAVFFPWSAASGCLHSC